MMMYKHGSASVPEAIHWSNVAAVYADSNYNFICFCIVRHAISSKTISPWNYTIYKHDISIYRLFS